VIHLVGSLGVAAGISSESTDDGYLIASRDEIFGEVGELLRDR